MCFCVRGNVCAVCVSVRLCTFRCVSRCRFVGAYEWVFCVFTRITAHVFVYACMFERLHVCTCSSVPMCFVFVSHICVYWLNEISYGLFRLTLLI